MHDENHAFDDPDVPILRQGFQVGRVDIGPDVWIGGHVVVLSGVRIGAGSVVGAVAVVTRDVPEGAVVVGVPARVVRYRKGFGPADISVPSQGQPEVEAAHLVATEGQTASAKTMRLSR